MQADDVVPSVLLRVVDAHRPEPVDGHVVERQPVARLAVVACSIRTSCPIRSSSGAPDASTERRQAARPGENRMADPHRDVLACNDRLA